MSTAVSHLAKPQMRGLLTSQIKKHLVISAVLCTASVLTYKTLVNDVRKKKYAEFYKNYDANKEFERMRQAGIFKSVRPDGE